MAEQLAGLGRFISVDPPTQHRIWSAGHFGQRDVEVDLQTDRGTQRIQMKELDGVGQPVLDQHALRVTGDAFRRRGAQIVGEQNRGGKLLSLNCAISPPLVFAPQKAPTGARYRSHTPSSAPASDTTSSARSPVIARPCSCSRRSSTARGGSGPLRRRLYRRA